MITKKKIWGKLSNFWLNRLDKIQLLVFFIISLIFFWVTEELPSLKYIFSFFSLIIIFFFAQSKEKEWIIFLSYFFIVISFLNFLNSGYLTLPLVIILITLVIIYLSYQLVEISIGEKTKRWFYSLLFTLSNLEILLATLLWPINNHNKSLLILVFFYLFWEILNIRVNDKLSFKKIMPTLSLTILVLLSVVLSSKWVGY